MIRWYLAGPMSGLPESNYPAFAEAAQALRGLGHNVVSPHETFNVQDDSRWLECLRHDLGTLMLCQGIILLDGWTKSRGARLELHVALSLELAVCTWSSGKLTSLY